MIFISLNFKISVFHVSFINCFNGFKKGIFRLLSGTVFYIQLRLDIVLFKSANIIGNINTAEPLQITQDNSLAKENGLPHLKLSVLYIHCYTFIFLINKIKFVLFDSDVLRQAGYKFVYYHNLYQPLQFAFK